MPYRYYEKHPVTDDEWKWRRSFSPLSWWLIGTNVCTVKFRGFQDRSGIIDSQIQIFDQAAQFAGVFDAARWDVIGRCYQHFGHEPITVNTVLAWINVVLRSKAPHLWYEEIEGQKFTTVMKQVADCFRTRYQWSSRCIASTKAICKFLSRYFSSIYLLVMLLFRSDIILIFIAVLPLFLDCHPPNIPLCIWLLYE